MSVSREVASDADLSELGDAVMAEVLEEVAETTRDADAPRTVPCQVTVEVRATVVEGEENEAVVPSTAGP